MDWKGFLIPMQKPDSLQTAIHHLKQHFFEIDHLQRTQKHISDPLKKSAAKAN